MLGEGGVARELGEDVSQLLDLTSHLLGNDEATLEFRPREADTKIDVPRPTMILWVDGHVNGTFGIKVNDKRRFDVEAGFLDDVEVVLHLLDQFDQRPEFSLARGQGNHCSELGREGYHTPEEEDTVTNRRAAVRPSPSEASENPANAPNWPCLRYVNCRSGQLAR